MNSNPEPGTLNPEPDRDQDSPITSTYVRVLVLESVIIAALWIFGRMFA